MCHSTFVYFVPMKLSTCFEICAILQDTGHYAPGIRFILELMPFLRETFGDDDIFKCPVCSALVIRVSVNV